MRGKGTSGFTLVELLVTIAIVAILLAIGLPSFQGSLRSNRLATATNELMASISLARTEAIRSTHQGRICASSNGATCSNDWNQGWLVWADLNDNNSPDAAERVRVTQANPQLAIATAPVTDEIRFDSRGRLIGNNPATFTLRPSDCPSGGQRLQRTLSMTVVGQVNATTGNCP